MKIKRALVLAAGSVFLFMSYSVVCAYVLQGEHILELMIEKLGPAQSLFVSQKLIFYRPGPGADSRPQPEASDRESPPPRDAGDRQGSAAAPEANRDEPTVEAIELEESLRYVFSKAFRSDAKSLESERIYLFVNGESLTIFDGRIVPGAENRFNRYKDLLLFRSRTDLAKRLLDLGVDVSISSLGRFEGQLAYVLGAQYPDETGSQIWFDKETFLPIRWVIEGRSDSTNSGVLEVRYLDWWQIGKTRYPSRIEFYQDGELVRVSQAKDFKVNPSFPEELFDIDQLRSFYPKEPVAPPGAREPGPGVAEEPSEVQKTIEEFRRIFE